MKKLLAFVLCLGAFGIGLSVGAGGPKPVYCISIEEGPYKVLGNAHPTYLIERPGGHTQCVSSKQEMGESGHIVRSNKGGKGLITVITPEK